MLYKFITYFLIVGLIITSLGALILLGLSIYELENSSEYLFILALFLLTGLFVSFIGRNKL